jgi:hypothetical protein
MSDELNKNNTEEKEDVIILEDDFLDDEEIETEEFTEEELAEMEKRKDIIYVYEDYNDERFNLGEILIKEYELPIIPIYPFDRGEKNAGKRPNIEGWQEKKKTTIEELKEWFYKDRYTNLGLPTGKNSGIIAVVVNGYDNGGKELLDELSDGDLPETAQYKMPDDGMIYLYAISAESQEDYKRYVEKDDNDPYVSVSLLGEGQYIVLPYSIHKNGEVYEFVKNNIMRFAPMPEWIEKVMIKDTALTEDNGFIYHKNGYIEAVNGNIFARYFHARVKVRRRTREIFYRYNTNRNLWIYEDEPDFQDYIIKFFNDVEPDSWREIRK